MRTEVVSTLLVLSVLVLAGVLIVTRGTESIAVVTVISESVNPNPISILSHPKSQINNINHAPIHIIGNSQFTLANGVVNGTGTLLNPFIIEGWNINATVHGIWIQGTNSHFIIKNCKISNGSNYSYSGVYLTNVKNGTIENNTISWNDRGLLLENGCDQNRISNNLISYNYYGTVISQSDLNIITQNDYTANGWALFLSLSNNIEISHNKMISSWNWGTQLWGSNFNCINNNLYVENSLGVFIDENSNTNVISNNVLTNNRYFGVDISVSSMENTIYMNDLINNNGASSIYDPTHPQARDSNGNNDWNYTGKGNYWRDWTSPDSNHDGIVDNPYPITTVSDYYPAVTPYNSSFTPRNFIRIIGNFNFTNTNGVAYGSGTPSNPYVIELWDINASVSDAIYIENASAHFVIRNCRLHDGGSGGHQGIYLFNTTNGTIRDCEIANNSCGIKLAQAPTNIIEDNNITSSKYAGIYLAFSYGNDISGDSIIGSELYGIQLQSGSIGNHVVNCTIKSSKDIGLSLFTACDHNVIAGNTISENNKHGITSFSSFDNMFIGNIVQKNGMNGFMVTSCGNSTLRYNNINSNTNSGISSYSSFKSIIENNTIYSNKNYGIYLNDSDRNNISFNRIETNDWDGARLDTSDMNTVQLNRFIRNKCFSIDLLTSGRNAFIKNLVDSSGYQAFYLHDNSIMNRLHHNNIINNTVYGKQAYDTTSLNFWNATGEGNHWSDWTSPDNSPKDGIVDIPYTLNGSAGAKDDKPLVDLLIYDYPPAIQILTPNGGENWTAGTIHLIKWIALDDYPFPLNPINLSYSINGGSSWTTIATNQMNNGTFVWMVPPTSSKSVLVKVSVYDSSVQQSQDNSNGTFEIFIRLNLAVTLLTPNGGETLYGDGLYNITWKASGGLSPLKISLFYSVTGNSGPYYMIINKINNTGTYPWQVPNVPTTNCWININVTDNSTPPVIAINYSDAGFSIRAAPIIAHILKPNGDENWTTGDKKLIEWEMSGGYGTLYIDLEYSIDNGMTNLSISKGLIGKTNYSWTVPNIVATSTKCILKIIITDSDNPPNSIYDVSDSNFTIYLPPPPPLTLTLISPKGGENWSCGSSKEIKWVITGGEPPYSAVMLEFSSDGVMGPYTTITSLGTGNSYIWKVQVTADTAEYCYIRATVVDNASQSTTVTNPSPFVVFLPPPPSITLLSPSPGEECGTNTTKLIQWGVSSGIAPLKMMLKYSTTGVSGSYSNITSGLDATDLVYPWVVPDTPSKDCYIWATVSEDYPGGRTDDDKTDNAFTIFQMPPDIIINIISPSGGEKWTVGYVNQIKWNFSGGEGSFGAKIEYSTDGGVDFSIIVADTSCNGSADIYNWTVPIVRSIDCYIRITVTGQYSQFAIATSNQFEITDTLPAGRGNIEGRVVYESGEPVKDVCVSDIQDPTLDAMTDVLGNFTIVNIPEGTHSIKVSKTGYGEITITGIWVRGGQVTTVATIYLKKYTGVFPVFIVLAVVLVAFATLLLIFFIIKSRKRKRARKLKSSQKKEEINRLREEVAWLRKELRGEKITSSRPEWYILLGVRENATLAEARDAFRRQSMKWHPDKFAKYNNSEITQMANEKYMEYKKAYEYIKRVKGGS